MFFYSYILDILMEVLSFDLHSDAVFGELVPPFVELLQQFGFEFRFICKEGT